MDRINTLIESGVSPFAIIAVIACVMGLFALLFGALCLHIATGFLRFERRSFRRAFTTHFVLIIFSGLIFIVVRIGEVLARLASDHGLAIIGSGIIILLLIACLLPPLVVKAAYDCSFLRALVAGALTGMVESALGSILLVGLLITLLAVTAGDSQTDSQAARKAHPALVQTHATSAFSIEEVDRLVGKSFESLPTRSGKPLEGARIIRRENRMLVVSHKSGLARVDAGYLLRMLEQDGERLQPLEVDK